MMNRIKQMYVNDASTFILLLLSLGLFLVSLISGYSYFSYEIEYAHSGSLETSNNYLRIFIYSTGFCVIFCIWALKRLLYSSRPRLFCSIIGGGAALAVAVWYMPHFLDEQMPFSSTGATKTVIHLGYTPSLQVMGRMTENKNYDDLLTNLMANGLTLRHVHEDALFMRTMKDKQEALLRIFLSQKRGYHDGNNSKWTILSKLLGEYDREDLFPVAVKILQEDSGGDGVFSLWLILKDSDASNATLVKNLLKCGVSPKISTISGSALAAAVEKGSVEHITVLLNAIEEFGKEGLEAAEAAIKHDRPEILDLLEQRGVNLDGINDEGMTLLHTAAVYGAHKFVPRLLKIGITVDAQDSGGRTPLHYAAYFATTSVTEALLKAGASISARDNEGATPLHYFELESLDTQVAFKDFSVDKALFTHKDKYGATLAHLLVAPSSTYPVTRHYQWVDRWVREATRESNNIKTTLAVLKKSGADPLSADNQGRIPIQWGDPYINKPTLLELLLKSGLDPYERDAAGRDLFMLLENNNIMDAGTMRHILKTYSK